MDSVLDGLKRVAHVLAALLLSAPIQAAPIQAAPIQAELALAALLRAAPIHSPDATAPLPWPCWGAWLGLLRRRYCLLYLFVECCYFFKPCRDIYALGAGFCTFAALIAVFRAAPGGRGLGIEYFKLKLDPISDI